MNKIATEKKFEAKHQSPHQPLNQENEVFPKPSAFESEIHPSHKIYDFMQEAFRTCGGHHHAGHNFNIVNR